MILRIIPALLILLAGLYYTLWHVWSVLPFTALWRNIIVLLLAVCFFLIVFVMSPLIDKLPLNVGTVVYEIGGSAPMIMLYTLLAFLVLDLARLVHIIPRSVLFSNGYTSVVLLLLLAGVFVYGNVHYYQKQRHTIELSTAKPLAKEMKLILISDLHIGYHNRRAELERWVELLNKEKADAILLAGDLVDRSIRPLLEEDMADALQKIEAPIYACFGNHEYFCGAEPSAAFYREAGIHLLRDSVASFEGINIIGRDDRVNIHRKSLSSLMKDLDPNAFSIVIDHQPWHLEEAEEAGVDFQLSGHTHDGQVFPMSCILRAVYENSYGASSRGKTQYYVTSGLGIWGGKFRIGTCSEYVVATIISRQ